MDTQLNQGGREPVNGALRGSFRSVRMAWTDEVSGERLTIETRGDSGFFEALESRGFERLAGSAGVAALRGRVLATRTRPGPRSTGLRTKLEHGGREPAAAS